ncbi:MAG: hypothetical protein DHS20C02_12620 [Micavibrio sp.]|nr:MAG: hypothetical protein DHS20C02_12620 [Micavibrio sp.]
MTDKNHVGMHPNQDSEEKKRQELVKKFGLAKDASWLNVMEHHAELKRQEWVVKLELPEDSSWQSILDYMIKNDIAVSNNPDENLSP